MKKVLAVLAVAGLASAAMAQGSFTGQAAFRPDHVLSNVPVAQADPAWTINTGSSLNIGGMFGAFNSQGFTNRGLFNFLGNISIEDPAGTATLALHTSALRNPYNLGGVAGVDPVTGDINFDAARAGAGLVTVPWEAGQPRPDETYVFPATQGGPDSYFGAGIRFVLNTGASTAARDITITMSGPMSVISSWFFDGGEEGDVANLIPGGFVEGTATGSIVVHVVPAPGAAALLGLGGLVAARRRRA